MSAIVNNYNKPKYFSCHYKTFFGDGSSGISDLIDYYNKSLKKREIAFFIDSFHDFNYYETTVSDCKLFLLIDRLKAERFLECELMAQRERSAQYKKMEIYVGKIEEHTLKQVEGWLPNKVVVDEGLYL